MNHSVAVRTEQDNVGYLSLTSPLAEGPHMVTLDKTDPTFTVSTPEMKTANFTLNIVPVIPHFGNLSLLHPRIAVTPRMEVQR
ncbi:MAG: hypothetical protein QG608_1310 [Actinomycetota bacterium]|nr:hypothetical protein [Actinomycetota bacterium]